MSGEIFFAAAGMGQKARGQALVAKDGFSARYDLDRLRGVFSRPDHKLAGESYVGRVLVLDAAKGGVATAWMLHEMKARGIVPAALVLNAVNPIMVQGAALADFTMISRHHAGDCERRHGGGRSDRRAAIHPSCPIERVGCDSVLR
jgi:predicted aconitase with swiveling domain